MIKKSKSDKQIERCNKYNKECMRLDCKDFQGFRNFHICEWYEEIEGKNKSKVIRVQKINIFDIT